MATVGIVRTTWQGTSGGEGLTQLAVADATGAGLSQAQVQGAVNGVRAFWDAIKLYLPNEVTLTVLPTVDEYVAGGLSNALTGTITANTAPATVVGTDTSVYAMAAGLKLNLQTLVIRYGRRVRGAMYIVPAGSNAYTTVGTVATAAKNSIDAAAATMLGAMTTVGCNLVVWSRWNEKKWPLRNSEITIVSAAKTNDKSAVLRGRRD